MAGSIGNVLNVDDALKHMGGDALRFFILKTHYRSPIDLGIWDWKNPATPIPDGMVETRTAHRDVRPLRGARAADHRKPFADLPAPTVAEPGSQVRPARVRGVLPAVPRLHGRRLQHRGCRRGPVRSGPRGEPRRGRCEARGPGYEERRDREGRVPRRRDAGQGDRPGSRATFAVGGRRHLGGGDALVAGLMQLLLDLRNNLRTTAKEAAKDNPLKKPLFDQTDLIRKRLAELGVTLEDRPGGTTWRVG